MLKQCEDLIDTLRREDWLRGDPDQEAFWERFRGWLESQLLPAFMGRFLTRAEEITEIDPELPEQKILELVTRCMVEFLGARSASVRIYDPDTEQMLSYGSHLCEVRSNEPYIPLEGTVAGQVAKSRRTYLVPNILKEALYGDKSVVEEKGAHSMMAVPFEIPRFTPHEHGTVGVIQIYFTEQDRTFSPLERQAAELMARRLSFVIARKKILSLARVNEKKETIVRSIFLKLGSHEGVKMKEAFNRVIPELADIINVQSCALFSVSPDREHAVLEAGYPETAGFHGIGMRFPVKDEPAFGMVLNGADHIREARYELVTHSYVLVMDPQSSGLVSINVKKFARDRNINSILYVPLNVGEEISHFMTFDALDQRKRYTQEEIEIFLFLGRELMKAQSIERLNDILHDFKNPAIATAGFARRLRDLIEKEPPGRNTATVKKYAGILMEETSRLQEMALGLHGEGKEQLVDLSAVAAKRFEINREALREQQKKNVAVREGPFGESLRVRCYPLHLERILDNLLGNATNAVPAKGGHLSIRTYAEGDWACAEISNTGLISEEERLRLLEGEGRGRGLYITHRILRLLKGKIDVHVGRDSTTLVIRLPLDRGAAPRTSRPLPAAK